jgi:hypothetical protein
MSIDNDPNMPKSLSSQPTIREVCYAGLFLAEELMKLNCPDNLIVRIQWHAGKASFGNDPWDVHLDILEDYKNNKLTFEEDQLDLNIN